MIPERRNIKTKNAPHSWAAVVAQSYTKPIQQQPESRYISNRKKESLNRSWKSDLYVLNGTGNIHDTANANSNLRSDTSIVAFNIRKDITTGNIRDWLKEKGISVNDCELLTKSNQARSLSFKISFRPEDFKRATSDSSLWPNGVKIRLYKNFNRSFNSRQHRENFHHYSENRNNGEWISVKGPRYKSYNLEGNTNTGHYVY